MFYNPAFLDKINNMQDEFNKLVNERIAQGKYSPVKKGGKGSPTKSPYKKDHPLACETFPTSVGAMGMEEFHELMDSVYGKNPPKHKSPTKRLMQ